MNVVTDGVCILYTCGRFGGPKKESLSFETDKELPVVVDQQQLMYTPQKKLLLNAKLMEMAEIPFCINSAFHKMFWMAKLLLSLHNYIIRMAYRLRDHEGIWDLMTFVNWLLNFPLPSWMSVTTWLLRYSRDASGANFPFCFCIGNGKKTKPNKTKRIERNKRWLPWTRERL